MYKISFDIKNEGRSYDAGECTLLVEVGEKTFNYIMLGNDNNLNQLKYCTLNTNSQSPVVDILDALWDDDAMLRQPVKQVVVVYKYSSNELVPYNKYDAANNRKLVELVHGDFDKGEILNDDIPEWNAYNVYRVPAGVYEWINRRFKDCLQKHIYTVLLKHIQPEVQNAVYLTFYNKSAIITALRNGDLQLLNEFEYKAPEDMVYWLLSVYKQLELDKQSTALLTEGMITPDSAMFLELQKFFPEIELISTAQGFEGVEAQYGHPYYFFSPILKSLQCV